MSWTRWKLLAGVLGLSVGGLAATCQEPASTRKCHTPAEPLRQAVSLPALPTLSAATVVQTALPPPLPAPAPTPAEAPKVSPAELKPVPVAVELPKLDLSPVVPLKPGLPPLALANPIELPKPETPPPAKIDLPTLDLSPPVQPAPKSVELPKLDIAPPKPEVTKLELPLPTPSGNALQVIAEPAKPEPKADPLLTLKPAEPTKPDTAPAKVAAKPVARTAEVPSLSAGVRVVLRLGDGRPAFDVLLGDDCLLKAVSDRVEVKAPGDPAGPMTPLKSTGGVRFTAPGCEGTCDALTVLPATGEVELTGTVRVRCKRGKGETEFSGGTMRFKLGTAPGYTVSDPANGTVQTSFSPTGDR